MFVIDFVSKERGQAGR